MANSWEELVDVDELDRRELFEPEEPNPSLVVSSSAKLYRDVHVHGHKCLH